jgi:type VI secretion system protein ImpI
MELILALQGRPPEGILAVVRFGIDGGTIGRSDSNRWMLRDADRTISARHAAISFENGRFFITDTSSNGILYGSRPIGRGNKVQISTGDRLMIGPYRIIARIDAAENPGEKPAQAASTLGTTPGSGAPTRVDPLAGLDAGEDLANANLGIIPENFDPLSLLGTPQAPRMASAPPVPSAAFLPEDIDILDERARHLAVPAPTPATGSPDAGAVAEARRRIEQTRVLPSLDGTDIGGAALLPVARRSTPLPVAVDAAETAAILAFWHGLGVGPASSIARMTVVGQALARLLDRGAGAQWREAVAKGDDAMLDGIADLIEPEPDAAPAAVDRPDTLDDATGVA